MKYQNVQSVTKAELRGNFMLSHDYIKRQRTQTNDMFIKLEYKKEQIKSKVSRRIQRTRKTKTILK